MKKKIAYVITPIDFGGAERVSLNFLQHIDRFKYEIELFLLLRPWELNNYFLEKIAPYNFPSTIIPVANKKKEDGIDPFRIIRCINSFYHNLKTGNFHLVHSHGYFADIISIIPAKLLKIPHVSTCHGFIFDGSKLNIYNHLDIFALRFSTKIIVVSNNLKKMLLDKSINENKVKVLRNAVDINLQSLDEICRAELRHKLHFNNDRFLIGYVGRLSKEKGIHYLLEAASKAINRNIKLSIAIIGDGPDKQFLIDRSKELKLDPYISFLGFQQEPQQYFKCFDAFVLPSITEGTPMALLEAMALGIPAIASSVGEIPKIIDHKINGILVSPADINGLQIAIEELYCNSDLRESLSKAGKNTINQEFSISNWIAEIQNIYNLIS